MTDISHKKKIVFTLVLGLFLSAFAIVSLESILRYTDKGQFYTARKIKPPDHRYDSLFGARRNFGTKYSNDFFGADHGGWRDVDFDKEKPDNTLRIAFVGDSFVYGKETTLFGSFSKIAQTLLNSTQMEKKVQVISRGGSGYGVVRYFHAVNESLQYSPDYLILSIFPYNDIHDLERHATLRPTPRLTEDALQKFREKLEDDDNTYKMSLVKHDPGYLGGVHRALSMKSRFYSAFTRTIPKIFAPPPPPASNPFEAILKKGFQIYLQPEPPNVAKFYTQFDQILKLMKTNTDKRNCKLIVLVLPCADQIYEDLAQREEDEFASRFGDIAFESLDFEAPNKRVKEIGRRHGVEVINLLAEFRQYHRDNPDQPLYTNLKSALWWGHFTSTGNELLGYLVKNRLMEVFQDD